MGGASGHQEAVCAVRGCWTEAPRAARWMARRTALCLALCVALSATGASPALAQDESPMAFIDTHIAAHAGQTGVYVLDTGEDALRARAWLVDHAEKTIDVQYFIWSTDNIGILAAEALLRAAERGVQVRVLVDDLMIDAPDQSLLALALHPKIDIRIYNPTTSVGVPLGTRVVNAVTRFRDVNQRMHDKTVVIDGKVAITGGRNMAAEYYDYNHSYNFRDRDALLLGAAVKTMQSSFEAFWASELSVPVEQLYDGLGLFKKNVRVDDAEIKQLYRELHEYAQSPANFAPEVRAAIATTPQTFAPLGQQIVWCAVEFINDRPGKNSGQSGLGGGGQSSAALAQLVQGAKRRVVIQSPYLVLSDEAKRLMGELVTRGVEVRINTNSLASTDNLPAFSGYRNQRADLLAMGLKIFEYRPDPLVQQKLMQRIPTLTTTPTFALHAKTLVVDSQVVFIGTFNLDPRSQNLNTEVGVIIHDATLARAVEAAIETDMAAGNSWNAATDSPDQYVPFTKGAKVRLLQWLPIKSLL